MTENDWSEEIPYSMEVGLLGTVRKVITLMPDNKVKRVVGYVVQHEALIALAHNKSIVFRTAVVRVSVCTVFLLIILHKNSDYYAQASPSFFLRQMFNIPV